MNNQNIISYQIPPNSPSVSLNSSLGGETECEDVVSHHDFMDELFDESSLFDVLLSTDFL